MSIPTPLNEAPRIEPVQEEVHRPLWSVMIPTFNCAKYLRQTLESVLAQDPGPEQMQIEVIDDCSTKDDPEAVVREVGQGRVQFFRKPKNGGAIANFNTCIERSRGHLVHILHGDDYVLPRFYEEILRLRSLAPAEAFFGTRYFAVDESGVIQGVSERVVALEGGGKSAEGFYYSTATQFCGSVVSRRFFEEFGGFLSELVHTADCEMWTRAISLKGGSVSPQVLSCYRMFAENDTGRLMRTAENIRDGVRLNSILAHRFSDFSVHRGTTRMALLARAQALRFESRGDTQAAEENWRMWRKLAPPKLRLLQAMRSAAALLG